MLHVLQEAPHRSSRLPYEGGGSALLGALSHPISETNRMVRRARARIRKMESSEKPRNDIKSRCI